MRALPVETTRVVAGDVLLFRYAAGLCEATVTSVVSDVAAGTVLYCLDLDPDAARRLGFPVDEDYRALVRTVARITTTGSASPPVGANVDTPDIGVSVVVPTCMQRLVVE